MLKSDPVKRLKYPAKQSQFYQFKIPSKTLDLDKDDDIVNMTKYVSELKVIDVYIEHHESLVESLDNEHGSEGDSEQVIEDDIEQHIESDNDMGGEGMMRVLRRIVR